MIFSRALIRQRSVKREAIKSAAERNLKLLLCFEPSRGSFRTIRQCLLSHYILPSAAFVKSFGENYNLARKTNNPPINVIEKTYKSELPSLSRKWKIFGETAIMLKSIRSFRTQNLDWEWEKGQKLLRWDETWRLRSLFKFNVAPDWIKN